MSGYVVAVSSGVVMKNRLHLLFPINRGVKVKADIDELKIWKLCAFGTRIFPQNQNLGTFAASTKQNHLNDGNIPYI